MLLQPKLAFYVLLIGMWFSGGKNGPREPLIWNHVCATVLYENGEAKRRIFVNGKFNFNTSTKLITDTIWPQDSVFTFGGRQSDYMSVNMKGLISDVQIFSRVLKDNEMRDYTMCLKVLQFY